MSDPPIEIAVIGDVHARRSRLQPVLDALSERTLHAVLLVGDLGSMLPRARALKDGERRRYLRSVQGVLDGVAELGVPVAWVPGNHDLPDLDLPGNVDGRLEVIAGLRVVGIGGAPLHRQDPYEYAEDDVRALQLPPADILLCHAPPARTPLDWVPRREEHVGSEAIRERALAHDGVLVCGHIHESPGATLLGRCLCLNVGGIGRPYGRAQVGLIRWGRAGPRVGHIDYASGIERWWYIQDRCGVDLQQQGYEGVLSLDVSVPSSSTG